MKVVTMPNTLACECQEMIFFFHRLSGEMKRVRRITFS